MIYKQAFEIVLDDIFVDLGGFIDDVDLLLKLEGLNPVGSIKIKTAVGLLDDARERGLLQTGGRVIESSSGNLGIALSSMCAALGYHFTCVADPNTAKTSIAIMRAFGAEVVVVGREDGNGGFLQTRIDYIQARLALDPDLVWPNQYANQANPRAHATHTAPAIDREVPDLNYLFIGTGTTGTLMGVSRYFRQHCPDVRIVAVDSAGSVTFGFPPARRYLPGLGTSRRPEIFDPGSFDDVLLIEEADAVAMCRRLAAERGLLCGGSTGSVLAAVARYQERFPRGAKVVAIGPDSGERYLDTVFDDAWTAQTVSLVPTRPRTERRDNR
jgi:N-(2-amino-2-carboxyethyl)-L-glutamate synthase